VSKGEWLIATQSHWGGGEKFVNVPGFSPYSLQTNKGRAFAGPALYKADGIKL